MVAHDCVRGRATHYRQFCEIRLEPSTAFARFSTPIRVAEQNQSNLTCSACPRLWRIQLQCIAASTSTEEWAGRGVSPDGGVARCHGWDHRRRLVSGQGAIPGLLSRKALPNPGGRCRLLGAGCATSPDVFLFQIRGPTVLPCDSEAGGAQAPLCSSQECVSAH